DFNCESFTFRQLHRDDATYNANLAAFDNDKLSHFTGAEAVPVMPLPLGDRCARKVHPRCTRSEFAHRTDAALRIERVWHCPIRHEQHPRFWRGGHDAALPLIRQQDWE